MKKLIFKITSVLVMLCMMTLCTVSTYATSDVSYIIAEDVKLNEVESEFEIPVSISDNQGIMGFMLLITYDSEIVEPVSVERGEALGAGFFNDSIGTSESGQLKVMWTGSENSYTNGVLFKVKFKVLKADFSSTKILFDYSKPDTFNEAYEDVEFSFDNSTITQISKGDVNRDGSVNISDATEIQKYLVNMVELDDEQKKLSDTDNDNIVSVMDATKIQKYIVNLVDDLGWYMKSDNDPASTGDDYYLKFSGWTQSITEFTVLSTVCFDKSKALNAVAV